MTRYVVGIDLGTTNCGLAYVDTSADGTIHPFAIPQLVGPGELADKPTLPSFALLPTEHEMKATALALPWDKTPGLAVGTLARERGAELPHRLVSSAKSWLSYTGVDRTAAILPWRGADDDSPEGEKLSPVQASARYLSHLRAAWNARMEEPIEQQELFLTVPASFDAVARELTVVAAREAGLGNVTLLEEPQAAFYSWLAHTSDRWRDALSAGDTVLVCDIGGGTTDFSLIEVTDDGAGNLGLERVAVGDHILLGGDNMDLALAYGVMQKLGNKAKKLTSLQKRSLIHACRRAKETLLGADAPDTVPISILGRGSKLIGKTIRTDVTRQEVDSIVLEGFLPQVAADAAPQKRRAVGLKELGLPYANDPAITRHLAAFLARHGREPTAILWNGGVMKGDILRGRVADNVTAWRGGASIPSLHGTDLDLAVAHGAAYYGLVRRGKGIRIRGGTAQSYYVGVESAMPAIPGFAPPVKALCVVPFGMEEGTEADIPEEELGLVVGETATFRFFASSVRTDDATGVLIDPDDDELVELDPVETELSAEGNAEAGDVIPVTLQSFVTELGTLELWCVAKRGDSKWKLEYSVRGNGEQES